MGDEAFTRLKWLCRRGARELDIALEHWLENHYHDASDEEKAAFAALLEMEDPQIFDLLLGNVETTDAAWREVVAQLRAGQSGNDVE